MIFYFSGTGNSKYVAQRIREEIQEEIISITKEEIEKGQHYYLKKGERLGIICPVYWWGIPKLVEEFLKRLQIKMQEGEKNYVYGVITYGLGSHNGMMDAKKILKARGITMNSTYEVKMVDNYVVGYSLADLEKQKQILKQAEMVLDNIIAHIVKKEHSHINDYIAPIIKTVVHSFYKHANHEKKFRVTDACIHCGKCQRECPCQTIGMEEGKPVWKDHCSFCLKCIHSCPVQAIQYGKGTEGRKRYLYPGIRI